MNTEIIRCPYCNTEHTVKEGATEFYCIECCRIVPRELPVGNQ